MLSLLGLIWSWSVTAAAAGAPSVASRVNAPNAQVVGARPVVVAIVDDAVRTTHEDVRALMWRSPDDRPGNRGHGWDVADDDGDVNPPADRLDVFFHGTQVAGIVADLARDIYGSDASQAVQLMAVKTLSDNAERTVLASGFAGIRYAVEAGADVVICAWGVAHISAEERAILDDAVAKGVWVVAAAGNFGWEAPQYPAAHPGVLSVAALGADGRRLPVSNHGGFIDLAAPGEEIDTAGVLTDDARAPLSGTSAAAAIVGGAAALLTHAHPDWSVEARVAALLNTARPVASADPSDVAGLGAGRLDMGAAWVANPSATHPLWRRAAGSVPIEAREGAPWGVAITPPGELHGIHLSLRDLGGHTTGKRAPRLAVYAGRSAGDALIWDGLLLDVPEDVFVPGMRAYLRITPGSRHPFQGRLRYRVDPIRQSARFCSGTVPITEPGPLHDGSGDAQYAAGTDCRWVITAPPGQVARVSFTSFDTEARTDWLYFFDGPTGAGQIEAIYSGPDIPPDVVSWGTQMQVWFVANDQSQGQGWQAEVTFEPMPDTPILPQIPTDAPAPTPP